MMLNPALSTAKNGSNDDIARRLRTHASVLAKSGSNLFRVRAFRQAAMSVMMLRDPVEEILAKRGRIGLEELPGIGPSLAETIDQFAKTGNWSPRTNV